MTFSNMLKRGIGLSAFVLLMPTAALAQIGSGNFTLGDINGAGAGLANGLAGATVTIPLNWENTTVLPGGANDGVGGLQLDLTYDAVNLTVDTTNCLMNVPAGFTLQSCIDDGIGNILITISTLAVPPLPNFDSLMPMGTVDFTIAAVPTMSTLVLGAAEAGNGNSLALDGATDISAGIAGTGGNIIVNQPDINATVNPVLFGAVVVSPPGPAIGTLSTVISNNGDAGTTLTGTCASANVVGTGLSADMDPLVLNLATGASATVTFTCDNSAIQTNSFDYECTGLNASSGATLTIPVSCDVTAPGPAIFGSTPTAPGGTFEIVAPPGELPNSGTFTNALTLQNTAASGNGDLTSLVCVEGAGDANITIQTPPLGTIAAAGSSDITFACDTTGAVAGTLSRAISCDYELDTPPNGADGPTAYTVECPIRAPTSVMTPSLPDLSVLTFTVSGPGGAGTRTVSFTNTGDPGTTATITSCVPGGTDAGAFTVTTVLPVVLMSGQTQVVSIDGVDPSPFTDATLLCTFSDDVAAGQTATYTLGFLIRPLIVPTLGQWGLILMALMLAGFGVYTVRAREQQ